MKRCCTCKQDRPESEFWKDAHKRDGLASQCVSCVKKYRETKGYRISKSAHDKRLYEKVKSERREYFIQKTYGITQKEYELLLSKQGGLCAICRKPNKLNIDHDHETGKVRGLLCSTCNMMLGHAHDSPLLLEAGIRYLQEGA